MCKRKQLTLFLLMVSSIILVHISWLKNLKTDTESYAKERSLPAPVAVANKIVVASVICSRGGKTTHREKAAVMIKSVIISSMLYTDAKFPPFLIFDVHLFLEHKYDEDWIMGKLKEFGYPLEHLQISIYFHNATDMIPNEYKNKMINDDRYRCMYVRHFISHELIDVDTILYVDTDIIFTGDIRELWHFKDKMHGEQLIAAVGDFHVLNPMNSHHFNGIPVPPPKGVNSGMLLMKLSKMRETKWEERLLRLYKDYSPHLEEMSDQKLLNILLYFDPGSFLQLPCQFNFWSHHCLYGRYCPEAEQDSKGIQVVHGASGLFGKGCPLYGVFNAYENLSLTTSLDLISHLVVPIKEVYGGFSVREDQVKEKSRMQRHGMCNEMLHKHLFKGIV